MRISLKRLSLCFLILIVSASFAKRGPMHGEDQLKGAGLSVNDPNAKRLVSITNTLIDTTPGAKDKAIFSLAAYYEEEAIRPPRTRDFKVIGKIAGQGSHRASTHPFVILENGSFSLPQDSLFVKAAQIANPSLSSNEVYNRLNNAIQKAHMHLADHYGYALSLPSQEAKKIALGDVLIHHIGDFTTSNTVGLGEINDLVEELLKLR